VVVYLKRASGGVLVVPAPRSAGPLYALAALMPCALIGVTAIAASLPRGDSGIAGNWFPAAALFWLGACSLCARAADATSARLYGWIAGVSFCLSGWFGAGIYTYGTWHSFDAARELVQTLLTVASTALLVSAAIGTSRVAATPTVIASMLLGVALNVYVPQRALMATLAALLAAAAVGQRIIHPPAIAVLPATAGRQPVPWTPTRVERVRSVALGRG
jgi:hypothetical protein